MKTRAEIKLQAKSIMKAKYGAAIVPYVLYMLIAAVASSITLGIGSILILPLAVGLCFVYLMLYRGENPSFEMMFTSALQENFVRKLGGMLLVGIYTFLWSLLFVIPGIIKGYSYALTPYILAQFPNLTATEAIDLSRRIMDGRKMELFIVDLSFVGWYLLGMITFGISLIFHTEPYMMLTKAGCFDEYIRDALANGRITEADLKINA